MGSGSKQNLIRDKIKTGLDHDPNFRWRGEAVTRIENLSDIVFALAMGMIVLSSEIPKTFQELQIYLLSFIPAFLSFGLLLLIWNAHFTFFRRYGVADKRIIFYNVILLFFVLYSAYPLKFAFEGFFSFLLGFFDGGERSLAMGIRYVESGIIGFYFNQSKWQTTGTCKWKKLENVPYFALDEIGWIKICNSICCSLNLISDVNWSVNSLFTEQPWIQQDISLSSPLITYFAFRHSRSHLTDSII